MSSTERAPEPTMEEILASIRRIISEDEPSSARQPNASASQQDDEGLEIAEGEADDKIINDIARVLSGAAPAVEEEEDILDLTAELGGLEPVEQLEAVELVAEAPAPVRQPAETVEANLAPASQASAPQAEPAEKAPEAKVEAPPQPMSASEEAASALERAIAALRAGHVPTSSPQSESQSESQFMPTFAFAPEPEPEPEPQPGPEPELVLTEFEVEAVAEEPVFLEALVSEPEPEEIQAWESEAPSLDVREEPENEPEPQAPPTNGSGAHPAYDAAAPSAGAMPLGASPKSLEDSIKDMLRPMLRQWLEENMSRVLTAALKDELKDELGHSAGQGQDD